MSIDRSNASRPVEGTQRIGEVRRVDREAQTKQYDGKNDRGKHGGQPESSEEPHDIIDLSAATSPTTAADPLPLRSTAPAPPETERHIDIKV